MQHQHCNKPFSHRALCAWLTTCCTTFTVAGAATLPLTTEWLPQHGRQAEAGDRQPADGSVLWDQSTALPAAREMQRLAGVRFRVIKKWDQPRDGYTFLHGVSLAWHHGKLFASFGHNKGAENTVGEEAHYRVSDDEGLTWSDIAVIDAGDEENLAVSHGVFHSHNGKLWAFHGAYFNRMQDIHTRGYEFDDSAGLWRSRGIVVEHGFWPMNSPVRMQDGNWVMPGFSGGPYRGDEVFPAAVAICHGDDLTRWDYIPIPADRSIRAMWGESAIIVDGRHVRNIARFGTRGVALTAQSSDFGRTWTPSQPSNLPMAASKPAAGTLSTGQHYLVCTTAAGQANERAPLTIALTNPGEGVFSRVFMIRDCMLPDAAGESAQKLSLAYPCATEHAGFLYVGYSNNGGRRGNLNSAELAIIPLHALTTKQHLPETPPPRHRQ